SLRRTRRHARREALLARALQDLSIRVETLQNQLASLGLHSRRLGGEELARVYHSCLTPERARLHPLGSTHLASVGRFPRHPAERQTALVAPELLLGDHHEPATPPEEQPRRRGRTRRVTPAPTMLPPSDMLRLTDVLAPGHLLEEPSALQVGDEWVRCLAVTAFPHEVSDGWLAPLLMLDEVLDLVLHIHPQQHAAMMRQLRRRRVGYASLNAFNRDRGRLDDVEMSAAQRDVTRMMTALAAGNERLFEVSFLLVVRAPGKAELEEKTERLLALLQTVFLDPVVHVTHFEQAQAFRSCLPEARDELARTMTLDATSLASTFPFMSNALTMPGGVFLGLTGTGEPVLLDPWSNELDNPHAFVGGVTGSGKSYTGNLWMERSLVMGGLAGERIWVIDPDGERERLTHALGGTVIKIAAGSPHHLNPFDLLPPGASFERYLEEVGKMDRLTEKIVDLLSLLDVMLADHGSVLTTWEKSLLDRALIETYRRVGISSDPRTHFHRPPLLRDLAAVLESGICGNDETGLGVRLSRYVQGSLSSLFAEHTSVSLDAHLLVWDTRDMRGDLHPLGIFLIADAIWTQAVQQSHLKRALYIDEAASILKHPEGGRFLETLSMRARKRYLRLVTMTQNPELFCADPAGSVVAANAAIKVLKKQDATSIQAVARRFGLTSGEQQRLLAFGKQEALLFAGDRRVLLSIQASQAEHRLITTNPVELAARYREERAASAPQISQEVS
ncbi:MAG TPA: conjugal transfer protein TraC, partial [Ktedonobacteraceae bacterium]|nr:conjugal transfer protein TraC [Ktedonobacteraceae bacterium]